MPWHVDLSKDTEKALDRLPRDVQDRLAQALNELETDPFQSNIKALKGPNWKGRYRKRVGSYRIIFSANHTTKIVQVSAYSLDLKIRIADSAARKSFGAALQFPATAMVTPPWLVVLPT